jgi:hypothetical protein
MSLLLSLPNELLARIVQASMEFTARDYEYNYDGDEKSPRLRIIKNLRLTCKQLATIGVSMFETVTLYPDEESCRRCTSYQLIHCTIV